MRCLLKQLIVPQVEYGCVIWHPRSQQHTTLLESVQRRYTKKFPCYWVHNNELDRYECHTSYADRLKYLKIFSLERRRERYVILMIYTVAIKHIVNPDLVVEVDQRGRWYVQRKFTKNPTIPTWIQYARNNGFHSFGPSLFNSLPGHLRIKVESPAASGRQAQVSSFKRKLDKFLGGH